MKIKSFNRLFLVAIATFVSAPLFADHHGGNKATDSHKHQHAEAKPKSNAPRPNMKPPALPPHIKKLMVTKAVAVVVPTEGNDVSGVVHFEQVGSRVKVSGKIVNLTPGKHGFHVHEYGDLTKTDGMSTGGHFNPQDKSHGGPNHAHRHAGDFGNITADEKGIAEFEFFVDNLKLNGPHSIIGRGLIVHADEDDLTSQPTGNAGARVGMAVIGATASDD